MSEPTTRDEVADAFRPELAGWAATLIADALQAARAGELGLTRLGRVSLDAQTKAEALVRRIIDATADAMKRAATVKVVATDPKAIGDGKAALPMNGTPARKQA